MSLFSSLKSMLSDADSVSKASSVISSEEYNGYTITPVPIEEDGGYRVNGTITKGDQSHSFIRADTLPSAGSCGQEMIRKAKQVIDQQGDGIFPEIRK